jgi:hypothetical protein
LPLCPVVKGAKKRTKEKAANHLFRFQRNSLCCSQRADASESRFIYTPLRGAPPNRFPAFAALLGSVKWQNTYDAAIFCLLTDLGHHYKVF